MTLIEYFIIAGVSRKMSGEWKIEPGKFPYKWGYSRFHRLKV